VAEVRVARGPYFAPPPLTGRCGDGVSLIKFSQDLIDDAHSRRC